MNIKIHQPKVEGCDDSFFYDGLVAETEKLSLFAAREIKIKTVNGEIYNDDKARQQFENDKELDAGVQEYLMNNWFEMMDKEDRNDFGDTWYSYDEALRVLIENSKEKKGKTR